MMYEDKVLVCVDCGKEFIWTAGGQEFYAEEGFTNEPKRCKECRLARKNTGEQRSPRQMYDAACVACGRPYKVPFQPSGERPVYYNECFAKMKAEVVVQPLPIGAIFFFNFDYGIGEKLSRDHRFTLFVKLPHRSGT